MMKRGIFLAAVLLLAFATAAQSQPARNTCPDPRITVPAEDSALADRICDSAAAALERLASCNVTLTRPIEIGLSETLGEHCVGIYHCGEDRIELLAPDRLAEVSEGDGFFQDIPVDRYWDSLVVHELAHAAYDEVPCPFGICLATSEYVARAMQIYSLSPEDRAAFEAAAESDGAKVSWDAINAVMALLAPLQFAADAWAHFNQRPDPCGHMALIMQGSIIFDREMP